MSRLSFSLFLVLVLGYFTPLKNLYFDRLMTSFPDPESKDIQEKQVLLITKLFLKTSYVVTNCSFRRLKYYRIF